MPLLVTLSLTNDDKGYRQRQLELLSFSFIKYMCILDVLIYIDYTVVEQRSSLSEYNNLSHFVHNFERSISMKQY